MAMGRSCAQGARGVYSFILSLFLSLVRGLFDLLRSAQMQNPDSKLTLNPGFMRNCHLLKRSAVRESFSRHNWLGGCVLRPLLLPCCCSDDSERLDHADDANALISFDIEQAEITGYEQIRTGRERRADHHIVVRISHDSRRRHGAHHLRQCRVAVNSEALIFCSNFGRARTSVSSASIATLVNNSIRFSRLACKSDFGLPPHNMAEATTLVSRTNRINGWPGCDAPRA